MSGKYATGTNVSVFKSREEIERHLSRYGATDYRYSSMDNGQTALIEFVVEGKAVRLKLKLPDKSNDEYNYTPSTRKKRDEETALKLWEQDCRSYWRAMSKYIQMTLEAIEIGIIEFEEAFLPYFILPDDTTVAEYVLPQLSRLVVEGGSGFKLLEAKGD